MRTGLEDALNVDLNSDRKTANLVHQDFDALRQPTCHYDARTNRKPWQQGAHILGMDSAFRPTLRW